MTHRSMAGLLLMSTPKGDCGRSWLACSSQTIFRRPGGCGGVEWMGTSFAPPGGRTQAQANGMGMTASPPRGGMHTHAHARMHMHACTCTHAHARTRIRVHVHAKAHVRHVHVHTHVQHVQPCMHTTLVCMWAHTQAYIHPHVHAHVHMCMCMHMHVLWRTCLILLLGSRPPLDPSPLRALTQLAVGRLDSFLEGDSRSPRPAAEHAQQPAAATLHR